MDEKEYKYDVAFSFLSGDEALAHRLERQLGGRVTTFLYSKVQEQLAGKDGELEFARVFGNEARIVVVLYRPEWGATPWTRIEETSIRNRGYEWGYDFAMFIPLQSPQAGPQWLPKSRLWFDLERHGVEGAGIVIEARVQEAGGTVREESVEDRARRLKASRDRESARMEFLKSERGERAARGEFASMKETLDGHCKSTSELIALHFGSARGYADECSVEGHGVGIHIQWIVSFSNTLDGSQLRVRFFEGRVPLEGRFLWGEEPRHLSQEVFDFDMQPPNTFGWRRRGEDQPFCSTADLAGELFKRLLDRIEQAGVGARQQ